MSDKKLIEAEVVTFGSRKKEYRSLSNFWETEVCIIDGSIERIYETGEHCFHGEKYIRLGELSNERKQRLLEYGKRFQKPSIYKTCVEAKKMGGKRGLLLNAGELDQWDRISIEVQNEICKWKYDHYEEVRMDLENSKGKILVHPAMRCSEENVRTRLWEGKAVVRDGKVVILGGNMLGSLWSSLEK